MLGIGDEADLELGSWDVGKSDGTSESLILLWVVVLETDLEFDGFNEFSLLLVLEDVADSLRDLTLSELAHDLINILNTNILIYVSFIFKILNHIAFS